jgi:hypothetical protein
MTKLFGSRFQEHTDFHGDDESREEVGKSSSPAKPQRPQGKVKHFSVGRPQLTNRNRSDKFLTLRRARIYNEGRAVRKEIVSEPAARERLSLSSLVPPKRHLLCVLHEKPFQFLLPDLIFSGWGFVTRPVKVDDIT